MTYADTLILNSKQHQQPPASAGGSEGSPVHRVHAVDPELPTTHPWWLSPPAWLHKHSAVQQAVLLSGYTDRQPIAHNSRSQQTFKQRSKPDQELQVSYQASTEHLQNAKPKKRKRKKAFHGWTSWASTDCKLPPWQKHSSAAQLQLLMFIIHLLALTCKRM